MKLSFQFGRYFRRILKCARNIFSRGEGRFLLTTFDCSIEVMASPPRAKRAFRGMGI
jgi:hypothetical protein